MTFVSYAQNFDDVMLWRALKHIEHRFYVLVKRLGPPCADPLGVINGKTFNALRRSTTNGHFWQGSPGLWRELLPVDIASVHHKVFDELGYECNPDKTLQNNEADMKWVALCQ